MSAQMCERFTGIDVQKSRLKISLSITEYAAHTQLIMNSVLKANEKPTTFAKLMSVLRLNKLIYAKNAEADIEAGGDYFIAQCKLAKI